MNTQNTSLNLEPGAKLAGVYLLQKTLETGGEPAIWLAEDEVLGKVVALHFLPVAVAGDERALAEIRLEVKRTRPLIHPNILRVYDLVESEGWAAVATEAFEGKRLSALLEEKGKYEVSEVADWLGQSCVALEEAHRIKLTHRDLAPENIFVTGKRFLLANFGIGRAIQSSLERAGKLDASSARWSSTAPQQLDGGAPSAADDVYGLGALFFHLLTGRPVFAGGDVPDKIRNSVPPRISDVRLESDDQGEAIPPGWENVIAACLNKSRDERPASPPEIVSSIEAYTPPVVEPERAPVAATPSPEVVPAVEAVEVIEPEANVAAIAEKAGEAATAFSLLREPEPPAATPEPPAVMDAEEIAAERKTEVVIATTESAEEAPVPPPNEVNVAADEPTKADEIAPRSEQVKSTLPVSPQPYDTSEDGFSDIFPKRFRFPAAVAAAVALVLFLVNGAFKGDKGDKEKNVVDRPIPTSDPVDRSELTAVNNAGRETTSANPGEPSALSGSPAIEAPTPAATAKAPERAEMLVAAGPATKASGTPVAPTPTGVASVDKQIAEKAAALEKLKAELANAEKQQQARLKEKQTAEAAVAEAEKAIEAKTKAAAAAKKETLELVTARKQREEEQKAAELAAQAAQQLAAEKMRAAEDAKKAFADFEVKNRAKLTAQDKVDAEVQALQKTLDDQRKAADESSRAATAAEAARQQQLTVIAQTEQELGAARALAVKAAEESQRKVAVDSERKRLDDEIAAMRALFEQKMKDIGSRRQQLESGAAAPPSASVPALEAPRPMATATPAPGLALMASRTEPPVAPVAPAATPALAPAPGGATNSLGMRFVPVADVQFSAWLTRWKDFDAFARAVNLKSTAWRGPGFRQGPDHPVVNVTWNEAIAFCKWLTDKERKEGSLPAGQFYRLPYDLEWSKGVGLAGETGKTPEARDMGVPDVYPWGNDWPPPKGAGNYTGEETGSDVAIKGYDDGFAWTSPVGSFPANKLGLYDMGGNVWQWCMDSWNADSKARVLRGASWYNGALKLSLLASCRVHATPDSSTDNYGFRIVRAAEAGTVKSGKK